MPVTLPSPKQLASALRQYVIGQDEATITLSVAVINHLRRLTYRATGPDAVQSFNKENVVIIGPTGSGKTHLVRTLARLLDLPFVIGDASKITQAGYIGGKVEDLLFELWQTSDRNLDRAQCGIVFLDEVDKIRTQDTSLDVNGQGVQRALLTLFNGSDVTVKTGPQGEIKFNTSNVLFICAGAFVGLDEIILKRVRKSGARIGYLADNAQKPILDDVLCQVTAADLVQFGFIPEFVGRLPVRTTVKELTENELCQILTEPKDSLVKQAMATSPAKLEFREDARRQVAKEAKLYGTGARGLQEIMQEVMRPITFENNGEDVVVTAKMVANRKSTLAGLSLADESQEPFQFSWKELGEEVQNKKADDAKQKNGGGEAVILVETFRKDHNGYGYQRRLLNKETGQHIYHVHRVLICTCNCGHKSNEQQWDKFVVCKDDQDPLTCMTDRSISWKCTGCGKDCTAEHDPTK